MNRLATLYKANPRIYQAGFAFIFCALVHNFPQVLSWLPADARNALQTVASVVINGGVGFLVIFLTKQFSTTGNGTVGDPYKRPNGEGGNKTIP